MLVRQSANDEGTKYLSRKGAAFYQVPTALWRMDERVEGRAAFCSWSGKPFLKADESIEVNGIGCGDKEETILLIP